MSQAQGAPNAAGTVPVRVQVIDIEPFAIDLVVPTYLPASDLTQRVARDAGLGAYWDDGVRRTFWLRARGRVMLPHEKLEDLGVVPGELLHLLPQPPDGSMVLERPPEYPKTRGYSAAGHLNVAGGFLTVVGWTFGWAVALLFQPGVAVSVLPAAGLSLLSSSFVRHAVGGEGSNWKVPVFGFLVYWPLMALALAPLLIWGDLGSRELPMLAVSAWITGSIGVLVGWLAWYGAVEPLPKRTTSEAVKEQVEALYDCGICGLPVEPAVRSPCQYQCGKVFHTGCYTARMAVHRGTDCAVCGLTPG